MSIVKLSAMGRGPDEGREGNADMANMACLGSDLVKEWGDVGAVNRRGAYFRESEAIIGIEQCAGFVVHHLVDTEKSWTQPVPCVPKEWW